jgi:fumarate hydratase class I
MEKKRMNLVAPVVDLIKKTATDLPRDVRDAIKKAAAQEIDDTARSALETCLTNVDLAFVEKHPICQDTGTLLFYIHYPFGYSTLDIKADIEAAVKFATENYYLRPNAVDSVTGKNSSTNLGIGSPVFHFEEWEQERIEIKLLLKGGGCENVGIQYSLPHEELKAGRDIAGVKKVLLDAVFKAQGRGCGPGIIGVGIGGDRVGTYEESKVQLLRHLDDMNPDPVLAEAEQDVLAKANTLGIGPMGFGGRTTLLGVKIGKHHRLPASYFVAISYMCWANRRATLTIQANGEVNLD